MTAVPCRGCVEKGVAEPCYVPDDHTICFDCGYPTPRERQQQFVMMQWRLEQATRTQRDRFAEAALSAFAGERSVETVAAWAWRIADAMIATRDAKDTEK